VQLGSKKVLALAALRTQLGLSHWGSVTYLAFICLFVFGSLKLERMVPAEQSGSCGREQHGWSQSHC